MWFKKQKVGIDVLSLALAIGSCWSAAMLLTGLSVMLFSWGTKLVELMSSIYIGYGPTLSGSIIGAIWGFGDGFVGGAIIAWIYNYFLKMRK